MQNITFKKGLGINGVSLIDKDGNLSHPNFISLSSDVNQLKESGGGSADLTELTAKVNTLIAPPSISGFAITGNTVVEVGTTVGNNVFTWTVANPTSVKTAKIFDVVANAYVYTIPAANIASGTYTLPVGKAENAATTYQYRLDVVDGNDKPYSASVYFSWKWAVYYGVSASATLDEAGVEALTKVLQTNFVRNSDTSYYDFAAGGYKYLAYPAVMGDASVFTMGGINVAMENTVTLSITNSKDVTTNYNIERTTNVLTGSANIKVA